MRLPPLAFAPTRARAAAERPSRFARIIATLARLRRLRPWQSRPPGALLACLPALLFLPIVLAPPLNHDVGAVLQFSQRWLGGEGLYSTLIDVNPPLIYVLNLLPAAIAAWTPLGPIAALQLCILAFGGIAAVLAFRARDRVREGSIERAFLDAAPFVTLLVAGYDFGQREHLMTVAALPYLFAAAGRGTGARPRDAVAVAVLAGVGFALKPHFLGIPALVEVATLCAVGPRRWLRDPVPWTMAAVWVAYLASLPILFPDYLGVVVPLVWDFYLDLGGLTPLQVLLVPRLATALLLLLPLLPFGLRRPGLPRLLALAALGALASAVAQHKGWSYHIVPVEMFATLLGGTLAARALDRAGLPVRLGRARIAAVLVALIALYSVSNGEAPWKELDHPTGDVAALARHLRQAGLGPGDRVLVLSPGIWPIFPALNEVGARLTLPTMNMWLLQGAYEQCLPDGRRYREMWEMGRPEFFFFRSVAEDFAAAPPPVVVVDTDPGIAPCGGAAFDTIAYFRQHPLFDETWARYRQAAAWDRYRLFVRKD